MTKLGLFWVGSKFQMITFVSKEQRYSSGSTQSVIVGKFHKWKQGIPIILLIVAENP